MQTPGDILANKNKSLCGHEFHQFSLFLKRRRKCIYKISVMLMNRTIYHIQNNRWWKGCTYTLICIYLGFPKDTKCVQHFDDSRDPAIHTMYRISLWSSSLCEPRHPLLKVIIYFNMKEASIQECALSVRSIELFRYKLKF